jgi:hypothetical protein
MTRTGEFFATASTAEHELKTSADSQHPSAREDALVLVVPSALLHPMAPIA